MELTKSKAIQYRKMIEKIANNLTDEEAINVPALFPRWVEGAEYNVNDRISFEVEEEILLYKCLLAHTSQNSWLPNISPSLWVRVDNPVEEWPEWIQPVGAQDAYEQGAKVSHNNKHWISDVNNNVWEPGVYGWTEQV